MSATSNRMGLPMLTLWQPWASLMALDVKTIETRSWPAPKSLIGQRMGIHAAKRPPKEFSLVGPYTAAKALGEWKLGHLNDQHIDDWEPLPLGAIVATGVLVDCVPMIAPGNCVGPSILVAPEAGYPGPPDSIWGWKIEHWKPRTNDDTGIGIGWTNLTDQLPYGDYRPGRWAWLYENVKPTTERCPWCWGEGGFKVDSMTLYGIPGGEDWGERCDVCKGAGRCDPVPAKGKQGIWYHDAPLTERDRDLAGAAIAVATGITAKLLSERGFLPEEGRRADQD